MFDPRLWLCTDTPSHRVGTCHGDSGGPLLWTNPAGVVELIGLTDWGFDGCDPPISAFTNLAADRPVGAVRRRPRPAAAARHHRRARRHPAEADAPPAHQRHRRAGRHAHLPRRHLDERTHHLRRRLAVQRQEGDRGAHHAGAPVEDRERRLDSLRGHGRNAAGRAKSSSKGVHVRQTATMVKPASHQPARLGDRQAEHELAAAHSTTVALAARPAQ